MEALWWIFVGIAILGAIHVSILRKVWVGHLLWLVSNLGMLFLNLGRGTYAEVMLWVTYTLLAVTGVARWWPNQKQRFGDDNEHTQGR